MKRYFRITIVLLLIAVCCFTFGTVKNSNIFFEINKNQESAQAQNISQLSERLFCCNSESENSFESSNSLPAPLLKNQFAGFLAILMAGEQIRKSEFSHYTALARTFLISLRKPDIIFPFNYFW